MTINESRLKKGLLELGPEDAPTLVISCQATAVSIEPETEEAGEAVEVLCGDELAPSEKTSYTLKFTGIQDFDDPEGFVNWAYDHDQERADFRWKPSEKSPTWSGSVTVRAVIIGGEVATRVTTEAEWPCNGKPVRTPHKDEGAPSSSAAPKTVAKAG